MDSPCLGFGGWLALVLSTASSLGQPMHRTRAHVQAAGAELIGEPCPDRARLSIHRGRRDMQEFHPISKTLAGSLAQ